MPSDIQMGIPLNILADGNETIAAVGNRNTSGSSPEVGTIPSRICAGSCLSFDVLRRHSSSKLALTNRMLETKSPLGQSSGCSWHLGRKRHRCVQFVFREFTMDVAVGNNPVWGDRVVVKTDRCAILRLLTVLEL